MTGRKFNINFACPAKQIQRAGEILKPTLAITLRGHGSGEEKQKAAAGLATDHPPASQTTRSTQRAECDGIKKKKDEKQERHRISGNKRYTLEVFEHSE